jgi:hypothetical protein
MEGAAVEGWFGLLTDPPGLAVPVAAAHLNQLTQQRQLARICPSPAAPAAAESGIASHSDTDQVRWMGAAFTRCPYEDARSPQGQEESQPLAASQRSGAM